MKHSSIVLGLSIAVLPILVNGQDKPTQTSSPLAKKSDLKDSVNDTAETFQRLMKTVLTVGKDGRFRERTARALGLAGETPIKEVEIAIPNEKGSTRGCYIAYEGQRPVCAYIARLFRSGGNSKSQYYRVDLDGKLERALGISGKRDAEGKVIKGSAELVEQDISAPEVQQAFQTETGYWLKDWLKKKSVAAPKKAAQPAAAL